MSASETNNSGDSLGAPALDGGVLAALPRTRPQRSSPRRAKPASAGPRAARAATNKPTAAKSGGTAAKSRGASAKGTRATAKNRAASAKSTGAAAKSRAAAAKPPAPPAPKQGYEPEEEVELGKSVNPPSGVELVESVADIFGELANSGLAAGGRILKDAFSLLRRP